MRRLDERRGPGVAALHAAAMAAAASSEPGAGHRGVAELLIRRGADAHARSVIIDDTALVFAAGWSHVAVVQQLLAAGARTTEDDTFSTSTPLLAASRWGRLDVMRVLLD